MQYRKHFIAPIAAGLLLAAAGVFAEEAPALADAKDTLSYAIGADLGKDLRNQSIEVSPKLLIKGVEDALSGGSLLISEQEIESRVGALRKEIRRKQILAIRKLAAENKKKGSEFLAKNKKQEGVVVLKSGLQYKVLVEGHGRKPTPSDVVEVHYRGTLIDGTEFDSSYKRNKSRAFPVKGVIKGWRQALQRMPLGSKWRLFIPPKLAYGKRGVGSQIGPYATLVFDVALISIKDKDEPGRNKSPNNAMKGKAGDHAKASAETIGLKNMMFAFKLDPRFMGGTYGQVRWVSRPIFQGITGQKTVNVRAKGLDAKGKMLTAAIEPEWIPADPDMVAVSPGRGGEVKITVKRAGKSSLKVVYGGVSKTLSIQATSRDDALQVQISQI